MPLTEDEMGLIEKGPGRYGQVFGLSLLGNPQRRRASPNGGVGKAPTGVLGNSQPPEENPKREPHKGPRQAAAQGGEQPPRTVQEEIEDLTLQVKLARMDNLPCLPDLEASLAAAKAGAAAP